MAEDQRTILAAAQAGHPILGKWVLGTDDHVIAVVRHDAPRQRIETGLAVLVWARIIRSW